MSNRRLSSSTLYSNIYIYISLHVGIVCGSRHPLLVRTQLFVQLMHLDPSLGRRLRRRQQTNQDLETKSGGRSGSFRGLTKNVFSEVKPNRLKTKPSSHYRAMVKRMRKFKEHISVSYTKLLYHIHHPVPFVHSPSCSGSCSQRHYLEAERTILNSRSKARGAQETLRREKPRSCD